MAWPCSAACAACFVWGLFVSCGGVVEFGSWEVSGRPALQNTQCPCFMDYYARRCPQSSSSLA